jgi:hypothetical protein
MKEYENMIVLAYPDAGVFQQQIFKLCDLKIRHRATEEAEELIHKL